MIYQLYTIGNAASPNAAMTVGVMPARSFLLTADNTPQFRDDITNGAVLQDVNGTQMTAAQVKAFLSTIP